MFIKLTAPSGKTTLVNATAIIQAYVSNDSTNPVTTLLMNKAICDIERIPVRETPEEIYNLIYNLNANKPTITSERRIFEPDRRW